MFPDFNRLHIFYHVFRFNSFKQAARFLHLTQPGISQHIRKLEAEVSTALFVRQHKRIIPTRAGKRLFKIIQPYIEAVSDQLPYISKPMEQPFGRLRIGAPLEFGKRYLPQICSSYRQMWPEVTFRIRFDEPDQLLAMLGKNDVDMAVIDFFSAQDQVAGRPELYRIRALTKETFVLACSRGYSERHLNGDFSYEALCRQDFLTDEHEPVILRHWFWHYFKKVPEQLRLVMAIESHPALLSCIRLGMGLAVTAQHIIAPDVDAGTIIPVYPPGDPLINRISLVQLREKPLTRTEKTFEACLTGFFGKA